MNAKGGSMRISAKRVPRTSKSIYPVTIIDAGNTTLRLFDRNSEQLYLQLKEIWEGDAGNED